jgi:hypothetical protein
MIGLTNNNAIEFKNCNSYTKCANQNIKNQKINK